MNVLLFKRKSWCTMCIFSVCPKSSWTTTTVRIFFKSSFTPDVWSLMTLTTTTTHRNANTISLWRDYYEYLGSIRLQEKASGYFLQWVKNQGMLGTPNVNAPTPPARVCDCRLWRCALTENWFSEISLRNIDEAQSAAARARETVPQAKKKWCVAYRPMRVVQWRKSKLVCPLNDTFEVKKFNELIILVCPLTASPRYYVKKGSCNANNLK